MSCHVDEAYLHFKKPYVHPKEAYTYSKESCTNTHSTLLHELLPNAPKQLFEEGAVALLLPLCLLRDFRFLSFTSFLGIVSVSV